MVTSAPDTTAVIDADHFDEHFACPSCGYDGYASRLTRCSECGLHNRADLVEQYRAGLRPLPFEYPLRSSVTAAVRTVFVPLAIARAANGYPPDDARRIGWWMYIAIVAVFAAADLTYRAYFLANGGGITLQLERIEPTAATVPVYVPALNDYARAARRLPVPLVAVPLVLAIITRHTRRVLRESVRLSEGDAERLFVAALPWLGVLLVSWFAAKLVGAAALLLFAGATPMVVAWLLTLLVGATAWRRVLGEGIATFGSQPGDVAQRLARSLSTFAMVIGVIVYAGTAVTYEVASLFVFGGTL